MSAEEVFQALARALGESGDTPLPIDEDFILGLAVELGVDPLEVSPEAVRSLAAALDTDGDGMGSTPEFKAFHARWLRSRMASTAFSEMHSSSPGEAPAEAAGGSMSLRAGLRQAKQTLGRRLSQCPSTCALSGESCDALANRSYTCAILVSQYGCDCSGCTCPLDPSHPLAPPFHPPAPPEPPGLPLASPPPPYPPLAPGAVLVETAAELHAIVANRTGSGSVVSVWVPSGATLALGGSPIVVSGFNLTLSGDLSGATIDGEGRSHVFSVLADAGLRLQSITVRGGAGSNVGGIDAAGVVVLANVSVRDCWSVGNGGYAGGLHVYGGSATLSGSTIVNCTGSASDVRRGHCGSRGGAVVRGMRTWRAYG